MERPRVDHIVIEKNLHVKWTCVVQTHVVHGSTVHANVVLDVFFKVLVQIIYNEHNILL